MTSDGDEAPRIALVGDGGLMAPDERGEAGDRLLE